MPGLGEEFELSPPGTALPPGVTGVDAAEVVAPHGVETALPDPGDPGEVRPPGASVPPGIGPDPSDGPGGVIPPSGSGVGRPRVPPVASGAGAPIGVVPPVGWEDADEDPIEAQGWRDFLEWWVDLSDSLAEAAQEQEAEVMVAVGEAPTFVEVVLAEETTALVRSFDDPELFEAYEKIVLMASRLSPAERVRALQAVAFELLVREEEGIESVIGVGDALNDPLRTLNVGDRQLEPDRYGGRDQRFADYGQSMVNSALMLGGFELLGLRFDEEEIKQRLVGRPRYSEAASEIAGYILPVIGFGFRWTEESGMTNYRYAIKVAGMKEFAERSASIAGAAKFAGLLATAVGAGVDAVAVIADPNCENKDYALVAVGGKAIGSGAGGALGAFIGTAVSQLEATPLSEPLLIAGGFTIGSQLGAIPGQAGINRACGR